MDSCENFRNATIAEPRVFAPLPHSGTGSVQTPVGRIPMQQTTAPAVPPRPFNQVSPMMSNPVQGMYGGGAGGLYGASMYGAGSYSNYGMSPYSMGGYGMSGYNRFGSMFSGGAYGCRDPMDAENRFIQLAEESSRPAFQSIESLVMAIGNIAAMLDSTFFALTSSFRAILGVAANFGRLRGVFAKFWSTFAVIRGITWLYKKALYMLGMSKADPSNAGFNDIFAAAANGISAQPSDTFDETQRKASVWPILTFLSFIFVTPYLIMKLIGQVSTAAIEESKNPATWVHASTVKAMYNFRATNPHELSFQAGQQIVVAPREVQQTQKLLNTGWALASVDNHTSGLIPINHVQRIAASTNSTYDNTAEKIMKNIPEPLVTEEMAFVEPAPCQIGYAGEGIDSPSAYDDA